MENLGITIGQQYQLDATGKSVPVSVTGTPMLTITPLGAFETISSGWLDRGQFLGALITIVTDVPGSYTIEFSDDDGETFSMPTTTVTYSFVEVARKGAFDISSSSVRFTYRNGSMVQSKLKFEVRFLSAPAQISAETLNAMGSDSRLAMWNKSRIETKKPGDSTNAYDYIGREGHSLLIHQTNIPQIQAVSIDGNIVLDTSTPIPVSVVNNPSTQQIGGTVTISNPTDVSTLAKESEGNLQVIASKDFATQSTLASVLAKLNDTITVTGFPTTQQVSLSGTPTVNANVTFPVNQPVSLATNTPDVTDRANRQLGHVTVDNTVATTITGTPTVNIGTIPSIEVSNDSGNPLPISGSVSVTNLPATQAVTGPLTDTQLRASAVPVSVGSVPLATNAATEATLLAIKTKTDNLDVALSTRTKPTDTQPVSATALPLPSGAATSALQTTGNVNLGSIDTKLSLQATSTKQDTSNTSLSSIDGKLTSVATTTLQTTANTSLGTIATNTTGIATSAKQDVGNTSLATISTNTVQVKSSAATITSFTSTGTSAQCLAANASRKSFTISCITGPVFISKGSTNSTTLYTTRLNAGGVWEFNGGVIYTGTFYCIGVGQITITEE